MHTRVHLPSQGYKERNAYIITQSPMTATVVDLWRLLNDHESRTVVMLDHSDVTDDVRALFAILADLFRITVSLLSCLVLT